MKHYGFAFRLHLLLETAIEVVAEDDESSGWCRVNNFTDTLDTLRLLP